MSMSVLCPQQYLFCLRAHITRTFHHSSKAEIKASTSVCGVAATCPHTLGYVTWHAPDASHSPRWAKGPRAHKLPYIHRRWMSEPPIQASRPNPPLSLPSPWGTPESQCPPLATDPTTDSTMAYLGAMIETLRDLLAGHDGSLCQT